MIFHFDVVRPDRNNCRKTDWTLPALKAGTRALTKSRPPRLGHPAPFTLRDKRYPFKKLILGAQIPVPNSA